jgi:hypothetical protein
MSLTRCDRKVKLRLTHPKRILVADECGHSNMNIRNDSSGSTGFCVGNGENLNVPTSNEECHFTNMCFTNLLGQPIIYVCIIKKEWELPLSEALGFNY